MPDRVVIINEEQRQLLALALALLWLDRPGMRGEIAILSGAMETDADLEDFVRYNTDRFHPDPL